MSNKENAEVIETASEVNSGDRPLTANGLLKWGGLIFVLGSSFISAIWFISGLKGDIVLQKQDTEVMKKQIEEHNKAVDKRLDNSDVRQINTDKNIAELQSKLDVVIAILNRIDAKSGRP